LSTLGFPQRSLIDFVGQRTNIFENMMMNLFTNATTFFDTNENQMSTEKVTLYKNISKTIMKRHEKLINSLRFISSYFNGKMYIMPHGKQMLDETEIEKQMCYLLGDQSGRYVYKLHSRVFAAFSNYSEYQIILIYMVTLLDSCKKQTDLTALFPKSFNEMLDNVRRCLHQILAKYDMLQAYEWLQELIREVWENDEFFDMVLKIYNKQIF